MNNFTKLSLLLVLLVGLWQQMAAQRSGGTFVPAFTPSTTQLSVGALNNGNRGTACDTISNLYVDDIPTLHAVDPPQWGYISGTNSYGDISKADFFTYAGSGQISTAYLAFAQADFGNAANTVRVSVWDDNGTAGAPGTVLGFQDVTLSSIAPDVIAQNFTVVTFSTPITITGNFYLGIQIDYTDPADTVALYVTELPRTTIVPSTAWEQFGSGTWYEYDDAANSWGAATAHWIVPIICPPALAPVANFSGTPTTLTAGGSVTFTDLSSGTPTSWSWSFPGGNPATSTLQTPPAITYANPGTYDVSLTVTNANGTDTETKTGYIQVNSSGGGGGTFVDCDTFTNFDLATVTPILYPANGWGYVSGHNFYGDSSKADFFVNPAVGSPVSGVALIFEVAAAANPSKTIRVKVWNNNGTGGLPGTVLATQTITIASIAADIAAGNPTFVNFTTPATPTGNYYVGISYQYAAGDTVALLTTTDGDVVPGTAYEQWSDGSWHPYSETPAGWGFNLSHFIFPIMCTTVPCPTISATFTSTSPVCTSSNGSITATGTGGTGPYTYSWSSPGGSTATINNLAAGNYTVTITDANGCSGTATRTLTVTSPTINANITTTPAVCTATNGSATAAPTGGTTPYTYLWSNGNPTASITNQAAGAYTVTITDANGCTTVATATIAASSGTLAVTASSTQSSCTAANGTATVGVTGGTSPFTYLWSNAGNTATITGLTAGTYTVTVTDANGCIASASTTVTANAGNLTITTSTTNATCGAATGTATVTPTGGTAPLTYLWSNAGNTATITGLIVGSYTVTVTDANGCSATATAVVSDPGSPVITPVSGNNVSCFGLSDGSATISVSGGNPPYTYLWSNGSQTNTATGLPVGTVSVTVTDASGCQATLSGPITGPSAALAATVTVNNNVTCPGATNGSLTANATDGTAPYSYSWSSGQLVATATGLAPGTYTVTVTDDNGCTTTATGTVSPPVNPITVSVNNAQTTGCGLSDASLTATPNGGAGPFTYTWNTNPAQNTAIATNLGAGIYTVTVTDGGGCTASGSGNVTEPGAHTANAAITTVTCNGGNNGSVTITPTGGSGNYTYTWSPNVSTTNTASSLTAGSYSVTVLDNTSGCSAITVANVTQPDTLGIQLTQTNVTCPGGSNGTASVVATGGNGGYTYTWLTTPQQSGSSITGLPAGAVILQVADNQSCSRNFTITITQPAAIVLTVTETNVTCNGAANGAAQVSATGGTGAFSYTWNTVPAQNGANATGLDAGSYNVVATDANGCTATQSATITEPAAITTTTNVTNVDCFNGADGTATVSATGGAGGYSYTWSTSPIQNTATATNLRAGTYNVTVTDANNCTVVATATVTEPTLVTVTTSTTPVACSGGSNGTATASATGGNGPYTYLWPSGSGATVSNLAAGTYTVTVTDANSCTVTAVATVAPASAFTASMTTTASACQGASTGTATVNLTGGASPFTYAWTPSSAGSAATASNLAAGSYSVTVTDGNGCTATATGTVASASGIVITPTPTAATCNGGTDGSVNITVSGGAGNYTYAWSNGTTSQNLTGVGAGTYAVTVSDANGCTAAATNLIVGEASSIVVTVATTHETAANANNGTAVATATGGFGLITYTWSNSGTGSNLSNLAPGTYTVTATDAVGCTATASGVVSSFNSIGNVNLVVSLNMFPNPTEGKINMNLTLAQPEAVVVEWYNAIGERVLANSFDSSTTVNHTFDLGNMAAGVYYARIQYAGQTNVQRVVLNK